LLEGKFVEGSTIALSVSNGKLVIS